MSAEIKQERARQLLATTTGLLSKSADSDTLVVDLISDQILTDKDEDDGLTSQTQDERQTSHSQEDKDEENIELDTMQGVEGVTSDDVKDKACKVEKSGW